VIQKICIISDYPLEQRPHLKRMAIYLNKNGWVVNVISSGGNASISEPHGSYSDSDSINISIVKKSKPRLFKLNIILDIIGLYRRVIQYQNSKACIYISTHPYTQLVCHLAKVNKKGALVYYSAELWDTKRYILQKLLEKFSSYSIDRWIVSNNERKKIIMRQFSKAQCIHVVPNSCFDYYSYAQSQYGQIEHINQNQITFIYQGTCDVYRRKLKEMIYGFSRVGSDVRLLLALGGAAKEQVTQDLKKYMESLDYSENIQFLDFVQYPEHFVVAKRADVGIMFYDIDASLNYRYCAPNKLYEYAMLGLPILSSQQEHLSAEIEGSDFGKCIDPKDPEQVIEGIKYFMDPNKRELMSKNARLWFMADQSYDKHGRSLSEWLLDYKDHIR
jgi:glycosyltransferase involved in cell wall biosynthesis